MKARSPPPLTGTLSRAELVRHGTITMFSLRASGLHATVLHTQHLRSFLKHCGPALLGMCRQQSLRGGAKTPRFSKHSRASSAQWHSLLLKTLDTSSAVADTASPLLMQPDRPHNRSPLLPSLVPLQFSVSVCDSHVSISLGHRKEYWIQAQDFFCCSSFLSVSVQCGVLLSTTVPWEESIHMRQRLTT